MTTKADDFRRISEQSRARQNTQRRRKARASRATREQMRAMREVKPHNVGPRAAKNAVVEIEDSAKNARPPRKSTRKTANRAKSSETLERQRIAEPARPQRRAVRKKKAHGHGGPKKKSARRAG